MSEQEQVGRTYLFKGDEAVIFEGEEVAKKRKEGWFDSPGKAKEAIENPPTGEEETESTEAASSGAVTQQLI